MALAAISVTVIGDMPEASAAPVIEKLECRPALPFYCQNIHVGCAGRSKIRTPILKINLTASQAAVSSDDGQTVDMVARTARGDTVLFDESSGNWIRLLANGTYAQRIHTRRGALMTRGTCRHVPDATR